MYGNVLDQDILVISTWYDVHKDIQFVCVHFMFICIEFVPVHKQQLTKIRPRKMLHHLQVHLEDIPQTGITKLLSSLK